MTDVPRERRHIAAALRAGQQLDFALCGYAETGDEGQLAEATRAAGRVLDALTDEAGRRGTVRATLARSA